MNPLDSLHLQMRLEGKALVDQDFIRQVEIVPDEEMPLMLLAQLADGELISYYDEAISPNLKHELLASISEIEFPHIDPLRTVLQSRAIDFEMGHYKTYVFPSQPTKDRTVICLSKHNSKVKAFGFDAFAENIYGIEHAGAIVSACVSARENERCGEAWVYTDESYRHKGFAQKVVKAWAASLIEHGKVPFYSHRIENQASANLARKLGLQPVFEEIAMIQIL